MSVDDTLLCSFQVGWQITAFIGRADIVRS
jgi:hypothetical protein